MTAALEFITPMSEFIFNKSTHGSIINAWFSGILACNSPVLDRFDQLLFFGQSIHSKRCALNGAPSYVKKR